MTFIQSDAQNIIGLVLELLIELMPIHSIIKCRDYCCYYIYSYEHKSSCATCFLEHMQERRPEYLQEMSEYVNEEVKIVQ